MSEAPPEVRIKEKELVSLVESRHSAAFNSVQFSPAVPKQNQRVPMASGNPSYLAKYPSPEKCVPGVLIVWKGRSFYITKEGTTISPESCGSVAKRYSTSDRKSGQPTS